jgi:hypothetical protein
MNKLFNAAEMEALDLATPAPASTMSSTAEAKGSLLQRWFNCPRLRKIARVRADPVVNVDSQMVDEKGWEPDRPQSALYDLAASNPHVIAASLFSRKYR